MRREHIIAACAAAAIAVGGAAALAWRRMLRATYQQFDTLFGIARVYEVEDDAGDAVRLLEVGGIVQSGTYVDDRWDDLVFEYLKRYDEMFDLRPDARRVCVLGCGGYDYPEHLVMHHPDLVVDAVEIDPAITDIARRYFFLDRTLAELDADGRAGCLNLICNDALEHLSSTEQRYDAIVNDTFDAGTPPEHLTTVAFMRTVRACLNAGGLYLTNIVSPLEGPDAAFLRDQVALLETVFDRVSVLPCAEDDLTSPDNVIAIAEA